jgi:two-component system, sensor histidine kinase PdtaS
MTAAERVSVMAKVQRRLVRSEGAVWADSRSFIEELCRDLESALIGLRPIRLDVEAESHPIPLNQAVSVGLIINELLVNALKYAFPDDRDGWVRVTFTRTGQEYCLVISDNGVGLSATRDSTSSSASTGLGQRLIRSFVTQLGGRLEIEPHEPGTRAQVCFPVSAAERTLLAILRPDCS